MRTLKLHALSALVTGFFGLLALGSAPPPPPTSSPTPAPKPNAAPEVDVKTREFRFTIQGGTEVIATTQEGRPGKSRRLVLFTPFLERTDGNLYAAALSSLHNIYGESRGLFQLEDVICFSES